VRHYTAFWECDTPFLPDPSQVAEFLIDREALVLLDDCELDREDPVSGTPRCDIGGARCACGTRPRSGALEPLGWRLHAPLQDERATRDRRQVGEHGFRRHGATTTTEPTTTTEHAPRDTTTSTERGPDRRRVLRAPTTWTGVYPSRRRARNQVSGAMASGEG